MSRISLGFAILTLILASVFEIGIAYEGRYGQRSQYCVFNMNMVGNNFYWDQMQMQSYACNVLLGIGGIGMAAAFIAVILASVSRLRSPGAMIANAIICFIAAILMFVAGGLAVAAVNQTCSTLAFRSGGPMMNFGGMDCYKLWSYGFWPNPFEELQMFPYSRSLTNLQAFIICGFIAAVFFIIVGVTESIAFGRAKRELAQHQQQQQQNNNHIHHHTYRNEHTHTSERAHEE